MAKQKEFRNNVTRMLDTEGVDYSVHEYPHEEGVAVDGMAVALSLGQDPDCVYKTLVTVSPGGEHYVFVLPVCEELDLKKAARAVGEKSVCMLHVRDLLPLTGYVRGGCSPLGMKKHFKTVFSDMVTLIDRVTVSAGKIGYQIEMSSEDLLRLADAQCADILMQSI